jgi:hypothetical protein
VFSHSRRTYLKAWEAGVDFNDPNRFGPSKLKDIDAIVMTWTKGVAETMFSGKLARTATSASSASAMETAKATLPR